MTAADFKPGQRVRYNSKDKHDKYGVGIITTAEAFTAHWGRRMGFRCVAVRWAACQNTKQAIMQTYPTLLILYGQMEVRGNELVLLDQEE
jgi:hypothetical protein